MAVFGFASFEIHPTTWGGAGVLLHHAARELLASGHEVVFLLDIPDTFFDRFDREDRAKYFHPERCRAYRVEDLCRASPREDIEAIDAPYVRNAVRFAVALERLRREEHIDFFEFFEYCGVGTYALAQQLFSNAPERKIGIRVHNSVELIDRHEATKAIDRDRYLLYGLERRALSLGVGRSRTLAGLCSCLLRRRLPTPGGRHRRSAAPPRALPPHRP